MNRVGELPGISQVGRLGFHPNQIAKRCDRQRLCDGVLDATLDWIVALGGASQLAVPHNVESHRPTAVACFPMAHCPGPVQPFVDGNIKVLPLVDVKGHGVGDGLSKRLQSRLRFPDLDELGGYLAQHRVNRHHAVFSVSLEQGRKWRGCPHAPASRRPVRSAMAET